MSRAYLSIGSNMGDRLAYLRLAVESLRNDAGISSVLCSRLYSTAPWGGVAQDDFINAALRIDTELSPEELLHLCQQIEQAGGRERKQHWGARTLDIDILLFDDVCMNSSELILPHPYMRQRRFVLQPLLDVADDDLRPLCLDWLEGCADECAVLALDTVEL